ncbi:MAG: Ig-like domain-containing protein [Acidobacteriota bacterium]
MLSWTIESGNVGSAFSIDASGEITVAAGAPIDFETNPTFTLGVRATDNGNPGLFDEEGIVVTVTNIEEPVSASADFRATTEDEAIVELAPGVLGNDLDPDGLPIHVISFDSASALGGSVSVSDAGGFTYDPRTSSALQALRAGENAVDTFSYSIQDSGGTQATATVSVDVSGVDAELLLSKVALVDGPVSIGSLFSFELFVFNGGPGLATGIVVTDDLPDLLAFAAIPCASEADGVIIWDVGSLGALESVSCVIEVQGIGPGTVTNTAEMTDDDTGLDVEPAQASAVVTIGTVADIPALDLVGLAVLAMLLASLALGKMRR